jgi:hypothetical protein
MHSPAEPWNEKILTRMAEAGIQGFWTPAFAGAPGGNPRPYL